MHAVNVICLKHQTYDGTTPPNLSCKTCCHIFVGRLREQAAKGQAGQDGRDWLAKRDREHGRETKTPPKGALEFSLEGV